MKKTFKLIISFFSLILICLMILPSSMIYAEEIPTVHLYMYRDGSEKDDVDFQTFPNTLNIPVQSGYDYLYLDPRSGDFSVNIISGTTLDKITMYFQYYDVLNDQHLFCASPVNNLRSICQKASQVVSDGANDSTWKQVSVPIGKLKLEENTVNGSKLYKGNVYDQHMLQGSVYSYLVKNNVPLIFTFNVTIKNNGITYNLNNKLKDTLTIDNYLNYATPVEYKDRINEDGANELWDTYDKMIKPVIMVGVGILFLIKGISLASNIVRCSDDDDQRSKDIKSLVGLFIGVILIYVLMIFARDIYDIVKGWIGEIDP